jgi:serine/threonine protein kinase
MKRHNYQPYPLYCVQDFATQLLDAVDFLHGMGLIHTDLKPENILLLTHSETTYQPSYTRKGSLSHSTQIVPTSTRIKVIDFGGATYDDEKKSSVVNTRQYRAPEVILGVGWSFPSDLWSLVSPTMMFFAIVFRLAYISPSDRDVFSQSYSLVIYSSLLMTTWNTWL